MLEIEIKKFVETVIEMRKAQKEFFRSRNFTAMQKSKILEKEVDASANEILKKLSDTEELQPDLFGEENA